MFIGVAALDLILHADLIALPVLPTNGIRQRTSGTKLLFYRLTDGVHTALAWRVS
jgi:hypothetical protein